MPHLCDHIINAKEDLYDPDELLPIYSDIIDRAEAAFIGLCQAKKSYIH